MSHQCSAGVRIPNLLSLCHLTTPSLIPISALAYAKAFAPQHFTGLWVIFEDDGADLVPSDSFVLVCPLEAHEVVYNLISVCLQLFFGEPLNRHEIALSFGEILDQLNASIMTRVASYLTGRLIQARKNNHTVHTDGW